MGSRSDEQITLAVTGLDALVERLAALRIALEPIEIYSNGGRHMKIPDADGNPIARGPHRRLEAAEAEHERSTSGCAPHGLGASM